MFGRMLIAVALPFVAIFGPMVAAGAAVRWLGDGWAIPAVVGVSCKRTHPQFGSLQHAQAVLQAIVVCAWINKMSHAKLSNAS